MLLSQEAEALRCQWSPRDVRVPRRMCQTESTKPFPDRPRDETSHSLPLPLPAHGMPVTAKNMEQACCQCFVCGCAANHGRPAQPQPGMWHAALTYGALRKTRGTREPLR